MKIRDFERMDIRTGEIGKGDLFIGPDGQQVNLENVNVLWSGVDTVRQLFQGRLKPQVLAEIAQAYEEGFNASVTLNNIEFRLMSGRRGGFKYLLQNREIGLTILVQNFYADADSQGTHVKIETSPRWLYERSSDQPGGPRPPPGRGLPGLGTAPGLRQPLCDQSKKHQLPQRY